MSTSRATACCVRSFQNVAGSRRCHPERYTGCTGGCTRAAGLPDWRMTACSRFCPLTAFHTGSPYPPCWATHPVPIAYVPKRACRRHAGRHLRVRCLPAQWYFPLTDRNISPPVRPYPPCLGVPALYRSRYGRIVPPYPENGRWYPCPPPWG